MGDAAGDDPDAGAVDPAELVAGGDCFLDMVEAGGHAAYVGELVLQACGVCRMIVRGGRVLLGGRQGGDHHNRDHPQYRHRDANVELPVFPVALHGSFPRSPLHGLNSFRAL